VNIKKERITTDLDLPEASRTQANLWKAKYFEAYKELVNANKGIRRLKRRVERLQQEIVPCKCQFIERGANESNM